FERAMDVLRSDASRPSGREVFVPGDAGRIVGRRASVASESARDYDRVDCRTERMLVARRRSWFVRSVAATGVTLLLALIAGGWLWLAFLLTGLPTAAYVTVLRRLKLQRDEARQVVRDLHLSGPGDGPPEPERPEL